MLPLRHSVPGPASTCEEDLQPDELFRHDLNPRVRVLEALLGCRHKVGAGRKLHQVDGPRGFSADSQHAGIGIDEES